MAQSLGLDSPGRRQGKGGKIGENSAAAVDTKLGKSVPSDFKEDDPWPMVFRCLAQDEKFWAEQVVHHGRQLEGKECQWRRQR